MPKCKKCGNQVKDPNKITQCPQCGKLLCNKCYDNHQCE